MQQYYLVCLKNYPKGFQVTLVQSSFFQFQFDVQDSGLQVHYY